MGYAPQDEERWRMPHHRPSGIGSFREHPARIAAPSRGPSAAHYAFRQRQLLAEMFAVIEQRAYRRFGIVVMPGEHGFDFQA